MRNRYPLAAVVGVALLSGCSGGPKIASAIGSISKTAATEAATAASVEVVKSVVVSNGSSATGAAAEAEYKRIVDERLRAATTRTLCWWLTGSLTPEQFHASLQADLTSVAGQLGIAIDATWMTHYINGAVGLTWQIAGSDDPQAAAGAAYADLGCA
jgi:outer membrane murein-binding lipoprotein Lpp